MSSKYLAIFLLFVQLFSVVNLGYKAMALYLALDIVSYFSHLGIQGLYFQSLLLHSEKIFYVSQPWCPLSKHLVAVDNLYFPKAYTPL